ncbi:MAG: rod shape-determining protein MreD [Desulfobacca sp.]|nr:rod shape-determining protein MreD [Desulfobacca sp.]
MIRDFFLLFLLGLFCLVLQSTWLSGETINPFRLDLLFIVIIFLGTLNRLALGLVLSVLLGMIVDILSWGVLGLAMILYPLIFWIFSFIEARTTFESLAFPVISVLIFQIFYGFLVHFFLTFFKGLEFTRQESFLIFEQAILTAVVSLPVLYLFRVFLGKKPSLA